MRNPNNYTDNLAQVVEEETREPAPVRYNVGHMLLTSRSGRLMLQDAMLEAGYDKCRALLTQSAMENTATLAAMTAQLSQVAPHASVYYTALLDAYARKAIEQVERW